MVAHSDNYLNNQLRETNKVITLANQKGRRQSSKPIKTQRKLHVANTKHGKMCTHELWLILVSFLIGWKSGAKTLNQSLSEVIINQSNSLIIITFDTQLKTALSNN